jgi:hypothetical protein
MKPSGLRRLFRFPSRSTREVRDDVRDEFRFHLEMRASELEAEGLDAAEARARALREFGDLNRASATLIGLDGRVNRQRGLSRLAAELRQDVSYGLRLLGRNRGFSATAVLTLALAIGGNVALFSIVNALFLQPLPIAEPDTLARVRPGDSRVSWLNLEDIRQRNVVFADVIAQRDTAMSMAGEPLPVQITAGVVSSNRGREDIAAGLRVHRVRDDARRAGAGHELRQPGWPVARSRSGSPTGDCRAAGARRRPRSSRATAAHGKPGARDPRWRVRAGSWSLAYARRGARDWIRWRH